MFFKSSDYTISYLNKNEWFSFYSQVPFSNLFQSYQYGESLSLSNNCSTQRILISDRDNASVAIVQLYLIKVLPFFHIVRINRGPLILSDCLSSSEYKRQMISALRALMSFGLRRCWFAFFIAPEAFKFCVSDLRVFNILPILRNKGAWSSSRIDLSTSIDSLLMSFHSKWRNSLRKSLKSDFTISVISPNSPQFNSLISIYEQFQIDKNFKGLSSSFLLSLASQSSELFSFNIYISQTTDSNSSLCGFLVSIGHGDTETYLLGWSNDTGRSFNVNYALLWASIKNAKASNCTWYDLGGLSVNTSSGISLFKSRLNGQQYLLSGEFFLSPLFGF